MKRFLFISILLPMFCTLAQAQWKPAYPYPPGAGSGSSTSGFDSSFVYQYIDGKTLWDQSGTTIFPKKVGFDSTMFKIMQQNGFMRFSVGPGNSVLDSASSILGGSSNTIAAGAYGSTIGGGGSNMLSHRYSFIGGGTRNTMQGINSFIGGGDQNFVYSGSSGAIVAGQLNSIGFSSTQGFLGGGVGNYVRASYGVIGGGRANTASGDTSFVGGGGYNLASGASSVVVGGSSNTASGAHSFAMGLNSRASGAGASMAIGSSAVASSVGSMAFGTNVTASGTVAFCAGYSSSATGSNSVSIGTGTASSGTSSVALGTGTASGISSIVLGGGTASLYGEFARGRGYAEWVELLAYDTTSLATEPDTLALDGVDGIPNKLQAVIDTGTVWRFTVDVSARTLGGSGAGYSFTGTIKNVAGTVAFVGTPVASTSDEDDASWTCTVAANDTNNCLSVIVTGADGQIIRWVATIRLAQVKW